MFVCSAAGSRGLLRVNLPPPPPHFGLFSFFFLYSSLFPSFSLWLCLLLLTTSNRSAISVSTPANFFPSSSSQSQKLPLTTCPVGRPSTSPTIGGGKKKKRKKTHLHSNRVHSSSLALRLTIVLPWLLLGIGRAGIAPPLANRKL